MHHFGHKKESRKSKKIQYHQINPQILQRRDKINKHKSKHGQKPFGQKKLKKEKPFQSNLEEKRREEMRTKNSSTFSSKWGYGKTTSKISGNLFLFEELKLL